MIKKKADAENISPEQTLQLAFLKDRLETFKQNWKELKGFKYCTPENFAAAGFYNANTSNKKCTDTVRCFSCQKELSDWEEEDDPWEEHVKRGEKCPFVLFKAKEKTTVRDFLELQYHTRRILIEMRFEKQLGILEESEEKVLDLVSYMYDNNYSNRVKGRRK